MKRFLAVWLLLGVLGCNQKQIGVKQESQVSGDDASFVEAFLLLQFAESISKGVPLVIAERLSIYSLVQENQETAFAADLMKQAWRRDKRLGEAVTAFCIRNTGTNTVDSIGRLSVEHVILTEKQRRELFASKRREGWQEFYKVYPMSPGIIMLSRPGFSMDGGLAVIYMGNQSDWLDGSGKIYVLEKKEGVWVESPIQIGPHWIS